MINVLTKTLRKKCYLEFRAGADQGLCRKLFLEHVFINLSLLRCSRNVYFRSRSFRYLNGQSFAQQTTV